MDISLIPELMSLCTLASPEDAPLDAPHTFVIIGKETTTLVCPLDNVPDCALMREDGWKCFTLPDSLYTCNAGGLGKVCMLLDEAGIPIVVESDGELDYIFLKEEHFTKALYALEQNGFRITQ
jgi:hypothetical protein